MTVIQSLDCIIAQKKHIDTAVHTCLKPNQSASLITAVVSGTVRNFESLNQWASERTKFKPKDKLIKYLIMSSLYQLWFMEKKSNNAIIYSAAEVTEKINRAWAKPVVYATLKQHTKSTPPTTNNIPRWLEDKLIQRHGKKGLHRCINAWSTPPSTIHIRVNPQKTSRESYLQELKNAGITASTSSISKHGICAPQSAIKDLPGLNTDLIYIQDSTHQITTDQVPELPKHATVLDACAAPGGKASALLNSQPQIKLLALEISHEKIERLKNNLQTYPQAIIQQGDATHPGNWWDGKPFDAIICDAPCSGTAVIQKHPEIKLIQSPENIEKLQKTQRELLQNLWGTLKVGGHLVYSTCSILPEENEHIIEQFIESKKNEASLQHSETILPDKTHAGAYCARIKKRTLHNISTKLSTKSKSIGSCG